MKRGAKAFFTETFKNKWARLFVLYAVFFAYALFASHFLETACPIRLLTGMPCPSCGMTRANLAFLRLDFKGAFLMHPLFILGDIAFLLPILFTWKPRLAKTKAVRVSSIIVIAAFIVAYVVRMVRLFPDTPPMDYFWNSVIGRIIGFFVR
ncbi:MAG: DUF2752 domain-containing protein [Clostridiales bacterium]|jgi:hypothetical protein|nr:DUF2752 domain-containing protein [Clostridiales bacterium]